MWWVLRGGAPKFGQMLLLWRSLADQIGRKDSLAHCQFGGMSNVSAKCKPRERFLIWIILSQECRQGCNKKILTMHPFFTQDESSTRIYMDTWHPISFAFLFTHSPNKCRKTHDLLQNAKNMLHVAAIYSTLYYILALPNLDEHSVTDWNTMKYRAAP